MNSFKDSILIFSHPDDESLFASSLLNKSSTLVICFNKIPNNPKISRGRKKALRSYPLKNIKVKNLEINQCLESFLPQNWLNIKDKDTGLKGGYKKKIYDENFQKILFKLRKIIPNNSVIVTHNPWGEYGHSEHCQVFKACFQISKETKSKLFVTGYISNLSKYYAMRKLHLLVPKIHQIKTNPDIFNLLRNHYLSFDCWTWYNNYQVPKIELFYEVDLSYKSTSQTSVNLVSSLPLNYIHNKNPLIYFIQRIIKKILPNFTVNLLRQKRFSSKR